MKNRSNTDLANPISYTGPKENSAPQCRQSVTIPNKTINHVHVPTDPDHILNNSEPSPNNEATSTDEITPNIQYTPSISIRGDNSIGYGKCEFPHIRKLNENKVKSCRHNMIIYSCTPKNRNRKY